MKILDTILNDKHILKVDPNLKYDKEQVKLFRKFINFCIDCLEIKGKFMTMLVAERERHGVKTTAFYRDDQKLLVVYSKNRMMGDIMRSIAHELTHKKQYEENRIKDVSADGADGSPIENEANAKAGEIIRKFINTDEDGNKIFA